jgi:hypothetical protein
MGAFECGDDEDEDISPRQWLLPVELLMQHS